MAKKAGLTRGQQAIVDAKEWVTKSVGLGECSQLCDVAQFEHVCGLIENEFKAAAVTSAPGRGLAEALRRLLVWPLQGYLETLRPMSQLNARGFGQGQRVEASPTIDLIQAAEDVATRLEFGPWIEVQMRDDALCLRHAWLRWIAYVASYWMWDKVPELLASPAVARELGRLGGAADKAGPLRSSDTRASVLAEVARLEATVEPGQVAKQVAKTFDIDVSLVHRYRREEKK